MALGTSKFLALTLLVVVQLGNAQNFDRNLLGVAFSPYVKQWENGGIPYFNSYSVDDIKQMLRIVSTKFGHISTYSMGVAGYNVNNPWDQADSNCLVARAAARLNQENNGVVISMNQGVFQNGDGNILNKEISNAFSAAGEANSIFPGTVWGITFTNEYILDGGSGGQVIDMIRNNKDRAHQQNLKVGARVHICGEILGGNNKGTLEELARQSDYIYCNIYPDSSVVNQGIATAITAVGNFYLALRNEFKRVNPNIEVLIGETGWPSEGKSFNNSPNTVRNLVDYWNGINDWARQNNVRVEMFEGFDEPWKNDQNNADPNNPSGKFGGEGHYGWWYRPDNSRNSYIDKSNGATIN